MNKKRVIILTGVILAAVLASLAFYIYPRLAVLNAYSAKKACSCHFISDRSINSILKEDLGISSFDHVQLNLDPDQKSVSASVFGLNEQIAYYHGDKGCILNKKNDRLESYIPNSDKEGIDSLAWPFSDLEIPLKSSGFKAKEMEEAVDMAFDKENEFNIKTRAFIIIKDDSLISERYAKAYDSETELLGWSMSKSIANILVGILVKDGKLKTDQDHLFRTWKDERSKITLDDLLRMRSGLEWNEDYTSVSNATKMLFLEKNAPEVALNTKLEHSPGANFEYSSGTTNILSRLIRDQFDNTMDYLKFPYDRLFNKLNIKSIILETDPSDNYVLSSYCYATPRDWGKLGLLYLKQGQWGKDTIFTKEYYEYSISPADGQEGKKYGSHIWLNTDKLLYNNAPEDMFFFSGYEGQYVFIIPSYNMVVVRMGLNESEPFNMDEVFKGIFLALDS